MTVHSVHRNRVSLPLADAGLYEGWVVHRRHKPKPHLLRYRVFYMLLDIDRMEDIAGRSRWFGTHQKRRMFRCLNRDHGPGEDGPLRPWVETHLAKAGITLTGGRILLMTFPRTLGYVFNPISIYFCYDAEDQLNAILYEVTNTFRERHSYLFPVNIDAEQAPQPHTCAKEMYVSPFIELDCEYGFKVVPPGDKLAVSIRQRDGEGPLLDASFVGEALPFDDRTLRRLAIKFPFQSAKVMAAIHWEALKLWLKGIGLVTHTRPPAEPVTIIENKSEIPGVS